MYQIPGPVITSVAFLLLLFQNMNPPSAASDETISAMIPIELSGITKIVQVKYKLR
jgi:hypothetical protein